MKFQAMRISVSDKMEPWKCESCGVYFSKSSWLRKRRVSLHWTVYSGLCQPLQHVCNDCLDYCLTTHAFYVKEMAMKLFKSKCAS